MEERFPSVPTVRVMNPMIRRERGGSPKGTRLIDAPLDVEAKARRLSCRSPGAEGLRRGGGILIHRVPEGTVGSPR